VPSDGLPRRVDALSLLSLAWILECAFEPSAPLDLSVQLSYLATLGLLLGARPLARQLDARSRVAPLHLSPWRAAAAGLARRAERAIRLALSTSCVAVAATLPVCWHAFGEWSPIGIVATVLLAPCFAWLLACGACMLCLPGLLPEALFAVPTAWLFAALEVFDGLPGTPWPLPPRPTLLVTAASGLWFASIRLRAPLWGRAAALALGLVTLPWAATPSSLEIMACDVGHGTAVLLRAPGGEVWVFDAGSRDRTGVGREALGPTLAAWEAHRIHVVASHSDRDHTAGLPWLVSRYPPAVWVGALPAPFMGGGERLPHTTLVLDVREGALELPARPPLRAALLRGCPLAGNEGSRSLLLEVDRERVLLCGDAEGEGLARTLGLLSRSEARGGLLLLPHHGSDSPWLVPLLEHFQPAETWVSTAAPPAVARELDRRGLPWRWTGRDGVLLWHGTR
jgi:competence protein ComEC